MGRFLSPRAATQLCRRCTAARERTSPSYEPVASSVPSPFQSSVVTSLLFSCLFSLVLLKCFSVSSFTPPPSLLPTHQMRAVESPDLRPSAESGNLRGQLLRTKATVRAAPVSVRQGPSRPSIDLREATRGVVSHSAAAALFQRFATRTAEGASVRGASPQWVALSLSAFAHGLRRLKALTTCKPYSGHGGGHERQELWWLPHLRAQRDREGASGCGSVVCLAGCV